MSLMCRTLLALAMVVGVCHAYSVHVDNAKRFASRMLPRSYLHRRDESCGASYATGTGSIQSQNYPANYVGPSKCIWTLGMAGVSTSLFIRDIETEVYTDELRVYQGEETGEPQHKFSGRRGKCQVITIDDGPMVVTFTTDDDIHMKGFEAEYSIGNGVLDVACNV